MPKSRAIFAPMAEPLSVMSTAIDVSLNWTGGFSLDVMVQSFSVSFWVPTYMSLDDGVMSLVSAMPCRVMLTMSLFSLWPASTSLSVFRSKMPCLVSIV
ncbi:hypothetical protein D3C78_1756550 [compost metagenome]